MTNLVNTFKENQTDFFNAFLEHIQISFVSLMIAILIAIPLAIILVNHKKLSRIILQITGILQTIPSLALLAILIPIIGIGTFPAIVALVIYGLFPIIQNATTGLLQIDPTLNETGDALGMTRFEKLIKYQLPIAMPTIMGGIRTSIISIIGTATLAALIGAGGLGSFILLGIDRNNTSLILIGAIASALLAIIASFVISLLEKAKIKTIIFTFIVTVFGLLLSFVFTNQQSKTNQDQNQNQIVIAGKLGAEQEIIANIYQELIEDNSDIKVNLKSNFGKTTFLHEAIKRGDIDIYPEYSGTILMALVNSDKAVSNQADQVYQEAKQAILKQDNLVYLKPMKFQNDYALAVKTSFAKDNNLKTISDLTRIQNNLRAGFTLEFTNRADGYLGLQKQYGLNLNVKTMEPSLRYQAINNGDFNLVDGYTTDAQLKQFDLFVLKDDKNLFPICQVAPLIRAETLAEYPELEDILNKLAGKITNQEMIEMNYQVDDLNQKPADVARQFLIRENLIKR